MPTDRVQTLLCSASLALAALPAACSSSGGDSYNMENLSPDPRSTPAQTSASRGSSRSASGDLRPAVVVNGQGIAWEDVWEPMAEYAGGTIVSEVVLGRLLEEQMQTRGRTITQDDVERERSSLTRTVVEGVGVSDAAAQQLVRDVTVARGLGPHRMDALLRRNAMLRVLASENVAVTEDILRRAHEIEHGRRYVTRLIVVADHREASDILRNLQNGPADSLRARFAEAAVTHSTDSSGASGGLLGAISPADTALPVALREAVAATPVNVISHVLALDQSFALAMVEAVLEPTGVAFGSVRPALEVTVRERLERLQMDVIARELLGGARVSVFDRSLEWGWQTGRPR